jgi:hypothetical protein
MPIDALHPNPTLAGAPAIREAPLLRNKLILEFPRGESTKCASPTHDAFAAAYDLTGGDHFFFLYGEEEKVLTRPLVEHHMTAVAFRPTPLLIYHEVSSCSRHLVRRPQRP